MLASSSLSQYKLYISRVEIQLRKGDSAQSKFTRMRQDFKYIFGKVNYPNVFLCLFLNLDYSFHKLQTVL